jgi:hypothetical protein
MSLAGILPRQSINVQLSRHLSQPEQEQAYRLALQFPRASSSMPETLRNHCLAEALEHGRQACADFRDLLSSCGMASFPSASHIAVEHCATIFVSSMPPSSLDTALHESHDRLELRGGKLAHASLAAGLDLLDRDRSAHISRQARHGRPGLAVESEGELGLLWAVVSGVRVDLE